MSKNTKPIEQPSLSGASGSADYLWCDIVGADMSERTLTVRLRDDEKPHVTIGDAARIFLRRWYPTAPESAVEDQP